MTFVLPSGVLLTNPCATCKVLYGSTCCESKTGDSNRFPMTISEAQKIAKWLQLPLEEVVDIRLVSKSEQNSIRENLGSQFEKLIVDGTGIYLPTTDDGSCVYLGEHGCTIPNAKPYICALFPLYPGRIYWHLNRFVDGAGYCLVKDMVDGDVVRAMRILGTDPSDMDLLASNWYKAQKMHAVKMAQWRSNNENRSTIEGIS